MWGWGFHSPVSLKQTYFNERPLMLSITRFREGRKDKKTQSETPPDRI